MANPYLAALIASWRREKKKRAAVVSVPKPKPTHDIWGPPLKPKKPPVVPPAGNEGSDS